MRRIVWSARRAGQARRILLTLCFLRVALREEPDARQLPSDLRRRSRRARLAHFAGAELAAPTPSVTRSKTVTTKEETMVTTARNRSRQAWQDLPAVAGNGLLDR